MPIGGARDTWRRFKAVERTLSGRLTLLRECLRLRYSQSQLGAGEFFGYRLYDESAVAKKNRRTFASRSLSRQIWEGLNEREAWGVVSDKILFSLLLRSCGFAQPRVLAFYDRQRRAVSGIPVIRDQDDLMSFLRTSENFPAFGKPVESLMSQGVLAFKAYERARDLLIMQDGSERTLKSLADEIMSWRSYMFQDCLNPAAETPWVSRGSLSTLRLVVLLTSEGARLFRARWKIPAQGHAADNFWREGNFLGLLNRDTGCVESILESTNTGAREVGPNESIARLLLGSPPESYSEAVALCLAASGIFPRLRYQAWDVALTREGPLLLELNHDGNIELLQVGAGVGILDEEFCRLLRERGVRFRHRRWLARLGQRLRWEGNWLGI
ncbi:hypothetical protein LMH63_15445 [Spiribacter halobius]|nr:sugar-transfer associated ATP-grasp domain-containing protein [Spiribacter halobius]UEX79915.1 hypothetical protein LMH63_15445 [Spiribacter halobius]